MDAIIKKLRVIAISLLVIGSSMTATNGLAQQAGTDDGSGTAGPTFAWMKQNIHFYDAARFSGVPARELLEKAIIEELQTKGLRFSSSATAATLLVGYTVVLENPATDAQIEALYEAEPELEPLGIEEDTIEQGIMLLKIVNANTREQVWKGTIRGLASLELPDDVREARVRALVHELLSTYEPK